jgi:hypothetical protein
LGERKGREIHFVYVSLEVKCKRMKEKKRLEKKKNRESTRDRR